jgi:hypothetical protein
MATKQLVNLIEAVHDKELITFFYLDMKTDEVAEKLESLQFTLASNERDIPFNAKIRGYTGATDNDGYYWIIKKLEKSELFEHRLHQLAYLIDHQLQTLSAPTIMTRIGDDWYRGTKVVNSAMQIGSYNYNDEPLRSVIANDLLNRWLMFDEDRNPNNYLVLHNSKQEQLVVAIDFNKVDLLTEGMKIKGNDDNFGWFRQEKTRFLTLLKPSNFEDMFLDDFEPRITLLENLSKAPLKKICTTLCKDMIDKPGEKTDLVINNIKSRARYLVDYWKKWYKPMTEADRDARENSSDYSGLGDSFVKYFKK